jgi:putative ABC transport system ATP-binding protein
MAIIQLQDVQLNWTNSAYQLNVPKLQVERGQMILIQGPSGCGKSTLLNMMAGIILPTNGQIKILGQDLAKLSAAKRDKFRSDHIGVIFQQFNLLPYLSLLENVQLPGWFSAKRRANISPDTPKTLLANLSIPAQLLTRSVSELSIGQQQRVAAARALIGQPEIILADEPTSALDEANTISFLQLLFAQVKQHNSSLICVSHDSRLAPYFDKVVQFEQIDQNSSTISM